MKQGKVIVDPVNETDLKKSKKNLRLYFSKKEEQT